VEVRREALSTETSSVFIASDMDDLRAVSTIVDGALGNAESKRCHVTRLARGGQAQLYAVRRTDGKRIDGQYQKLVVKLYAKTDELAVEACKLEFASLEKLRSAVDGFRVHDWMIKIPKVLAISKNPTALLMTWVPGKELDLLVRGGFLRTLPAMRSMAETIVSCLHTYWNSSSEIYGDLNLKNILCAPSEGVIAFIDPGCPGPHYLCPTVSETWYPASRDVARLLFEIAATNVRLRVISPLAAVRRSRLATTILIESVRVLAAEGQGAALAAEVGACADIHLASMETSYTPTGLWRLFVRFVSAKQISRWLCSHQRESSLSPA